MNFNENWTKFEFEIKKSKFISFAFQINKLADFEQLLDCLTIEYKKASHICYAYHLFQNDQEKIKYFDAGEPKGTAGKPIYSIINQKNQKNIVVFVIRFFGGTKLGAGTLLRSYLKAANNSLTNVNKI